MKKNPFQTDGTDNSELDNEAALGIGLADDDLANAEEESLTEDGDDGLDDGDEAGV